MPKLTKMNWLDHGLESLEAHGFTSLKADVLARSLGVSRGSFYHHFADISDFHAAVLHRWHERSVALAIELEGECLEPASKLHAMIERVARDGELLEQAVRAWAFSDPHVAETVKAVDQARMDYIKRVLVETGLDEETAHRRTNLLYLSNVGHKFLAGVLSADDRAMVVTDLVEFAVD